MGAGHLGGKIEAAFLSGDAMAQAIIGHLSNGTGGT